MATNTLWQRTQLGFLPPQMSFGTQQLSSYPFPHRLPGLQASAPQLSSQLQFNMGVPLSPDNMATRFRRPKPLIIEKLEGPKQKLEQNRTFVTTSVEVLPSSLPTNRLSFAVNLARRDIKRAKLMPTPDNQVPNEEQVNVKSVKPSEEKATKSKKAKKIENVQSKETIRHRVQKALRHHDKELHRGQELYFYPGTGPEIEGESPQAKEICKLRKELHAYMNQLGNIQKDGPLIVRNKDKRMKRRQDGNNRLSDEEVDERQVARAEEQAARSSRMLYMLKCQVQDLQDELNKKGTHIRHTKKSQTLHRLAAAHRAAVRALQTFISQSPLHPKGSQAPAYMYQDLAILIRQLSLLTTQLQVATDDQLDDLVLGKTASQGAGGYDMREKFESRKQNAFYRETDGGSFPYQTLPSPPTKDRKQPIARVRERQKSPNPSPERDSVLRAGLQALVRAREEALNGKQPDNSKAKVHMTTRPLPEKKSLLLPAQLKAKRQRAQQMAQRVKPADLQNAHFAKDTVASNLRKVPPAQDKQETVDQPPKPLPRTPTKSPSQTPRRGTPTKRFGTPERLCEQLQASPQSNRRKLEDEFKSPRSPKYQRQMLQEERKMLEREIARQAWLDREAELRIQEFKEDDRRRRNYQPATSSSDGAHLARKIIYETEEAITQRLKPLLDRAEDIMKENKKHDEMKKQSLQHQLTSLTSRTTMEQANVLADGILDDLLYDTVLELQRVEEDDEAEVIASGIQNSSTLENVMQRLQNFEKVENDIRRHWTQIKYAETQTQTRTDRHKTDANSQGTLPKEPEAIMFTVNRPERTDDLLISRIDKLKKRSQSRKDKARFHIQESDSTASLLDGISSPRGSDVLYDNDSSHQPPTKGLTRPTPTLFVPSELRASIASYRSKYERFLRGTATHVKGSFNPWTLDEKISEELLDDLLQDVVEDLGQGYDEYTETIYKQEFVAVGSDKSITQ